jgi:hypothetical protein
MSTNNVCTIIGTPDAVERAEQLVRDIVARAHHTPPRAGKGEILVSVTCPREMIGLVVGAGGSQIEEIKGERDALRVPRKCTWAHAHRRST